MRNPIILVILLCAPLSGAAEYVHPAAAWSMSVPDGQMVRAFVDEAGFPYHVIAAEQIDNPAEMGRGMWIYTVPIPSDDQLEPALLIPMVNGLITRAEPRLKLASDRATEMAVGMGKAKGIAVDVGGRRGKTGDWRGQVVIVVSEDHFLAVHFGGPADQWDQVRPDATKMLNTLITPLRLAVIDPAPSTPLSEPDLTLLLKQCTPIVYVSGRRDVKDEDSREPMGSGTGFIIRPEGFVITNRHVVESRKRSDGVTRLGYDPVRLEWDKDLKMDAVEADVIAVSYQWDLALLRIRGNKKWRSVPFADASAVREGHEVRVAGWPLPQKFGRDHITITRGKVLGFDNDPRGRPLMVKHSAETHKGNSGGAVFDVNLGAVVAAHYCGVLDKSEKPDPLGEYKQLYAGGVPVQRILWEFPQVAATWQDRCANMEERRALLAYFFLQERFGAAMIESRRALKDSAADGMTSAYMYRMFVRQRDSERALESLKSARRAPDSNYICALYASQSNLENGDFLEATQWANSAFQLRQNDPRSTMAFARAQLASGSNPDWALGATSQLLPSPDAELEMLKGRAAIQNFIVGARVVRLPPSRPLGDQLTTDAAIALEKSIELWPVRNGRAYANLAMLYGLDGRKKKSAEMQLRALQTSPRDVETLLTVAHLDLIQGDPLAALKLIGAARDIEDKPFAQFLEGWAGLLIAPPLAKTDRPAAVAIARASIELIAQSRDASRHTWWQSYSAQVQTQLTGR